MVSDLKTFSNKGCKIEAKKENKIGQSLQGSGGYTTRIRRFYNKFQEVMFSDAIIEPLQKTFAYKGCKISAHNYFFFLLILPKYQKFFFYIGATIRIGQDMLYLPYAGFFFYLLFFYYFFFWIFVGI